VGGLFLAIFFSKKKFFRVGDLIFTPFFSQNKKKIRGLGEIEKKNLK